MIDVPRDSIKMLWNESFAPVLSKAMCSAVGMIKDAEATAIKDDIVDAAVALKLQSLLKPPTKRQHPRPFFVRDAA